MTSKYEPPIPKFDSVKKPYKRYREEIEYWNLISKIEKKEKGLHLAYVLPDDDPSDIKDKLFVELGREKLNCDDGVKNFTEYMDKLFKTDDLTEHYEEYVKFDCFKRTNESLSDFINEFEKLHNVVKHRDMKLPDPMTWIPAPKIIRSPVQRKKMMKTLLLYTPKAL